MDLVQYFHEIYTGSTRVAFMQTLTLVKIVRIRTLLAYLEHSLQVSFVVDSSCLFYDQNHEFLQIINVKPVWRMVLRYIIITGLVMHWDACIDFSVQKYYMLYTDQIIPHSWTVRRRIFNETSLKKVYITSMFRSVSTFVGNF